MIKTLIVEDDPMVREITENYIDDINGYSVIGKCENGLDALSFLKTNQVNLIIADINMPKMDGITFLKNLRASHNNAEVIFVTGLHDTETIKSALTYGAVDYIVKPFNCDRFISTLNSFKKRFDTLNTRSDISQTDIDKFLNNTLRSNKIELPKGLQNTTLQKVLKYIQKSERDFSINDISDELNMSKVSLRHYLDYLIENNKISFDIEYGKVGRPKYTYRKNTEL